MRWRELIERIPEESPELHRTTVPNFLGTCITEDRSRPIKGWWRITEELRKLAERPEELDR